MSKSLNEGHVILWRWKRDGKDGFVGFQENTVHEVKKDFLTFDRWSKANRNWIKISEIEYEIVGHRNILR